MIETPKNKMTRLLSLYAESAAVDLVVAEHNGATTYSLQLPDSFTSIYQRTWHYRTTTNQKFYEEFLVGAVKALNGAGEEQG